MSKLIDLVKEKSELKDVQDFFRQHSFKVFLWADAWRKVKTEYALQWNKVEFGKASVNKVPEVRGIYAFSISIKNSVMPSHGVIVYFGETSRTLRMRYTEYIRDSRHGAKRTKLKNLFDLWVSDLDFFLCSNTGPRL